MGTLSEADTALVTAVRVELDTLRIGGGSVMDVVLPEVRRVLDVESVLLYSLRDGKTTFEVERWDQVGLPRQAEVRCRAMVERTTSPVFYDPIRPARDQRNRVVEATAWIDRHRPGTWEASTMCRDVMQPLQLHRHKQLRALLCEGPALLAWFGVIHPDPVTQRQRRLLSALVPAMHRRLSVERRLLAAPRVSAGFEAALDQLGSAAFIVGPRGRIHETNEAARVLLAERRSEVAAALRDAVAHRPNDLRFELIDLRSRGMPDHSLAILRIEGAEARLRACVQHCAARWKLTRRQAEVLAFLARGAANATIAGALGTGERVVELHVTAIFDRAGVENRAALVARVLTSLR